MANRNTELARLNGDLSNLQNSTRLPVILLGRDQTSPSTPSSPGRFQTGIETSTPKKSAVPKSLKLEDLAREVIDTVREQEHEVKDERDRWFSLRLRPYMTPDNKVDGAVLVLVDIDAIKQNERIQAALDFARSIVDTLREPLLVLDQELRVRSAGRAFYETFRVSPEETIDQFFYELGSHQWDIPRLRTLLEEILPRRIDSVLNTLAEETRKLGADVRNSGPWPKVLAHEATLTQVLSNLVSNALKFTLPAHTITFRLTTKWCNDRIPYPVAADVRRLISPSPSRARFENREILEIRGLERNDQSPQVRVPDFSARIRGEPQHRRSAKADGQNQDWKPARNRPAISSHEQGQRR